MLSRLYKLFFDLGICYTLGAFLVCYFAGDSLQFEGFICLLATAVIGIVLRKKKKLWIVTTICVPIVGLFLLRSELIPLAVYVLSWGYIAFLIITDRFVTSRGEFLDQVRKLLYFALVLPILMLTEFHIVLQSIVAAVPYLITAMVSFGFMLRHLRSDHGMESQKGYHRQQIWEMILFITICVLLTVVRAPQNLLTGLSLLYINVIQPVISFLARLISLIFGGMIYLIISIVSLFTENRELALRKAEVEDGLFVSLDLSVDTVSSKEWIVPLLYSLAAILGLIVVFLFFRWLMGEKYKQRLPEGISEIRETVVDSGDRQGKINGKYSKEPRERIRYYYNKYLIYLRSRKVTILSVDTTSDVEQKYLESSSQPSMRQMEASMRMKNLYRKARYQNREEITKEEAEQAKKIYDILKSKKNNSI